MVAYLSRLKRLLACVFIGALISFAVYLFKLQNKSESIAKGEVGESDFHEARIVDLKWDREIREIPDSLASLREKLSAKPRSEAVGEIEVFLRKGKDSPIVISGFKSFSCAPGITYLSYS